MKDFLKNIKIEEYKKVAESLLGNLPNVKGNIKNVLPNFPVIFKNDESIQWQQPFVFILRYNKYYQTNTEIRNNDYVVIITDKVNVFECTADPKKRRNDIANIANNQAYFGNIRNHNFQPGNICIAQDYCDLIVRRYYSYMRRYGRGQDLITTGYDKDLKLWYIEERGRFHINLHRSSYYNSSLGCAIIAGHDEDEFKTLLKEIKKTQKINIPVVVLSFIDMVTQYAAGNEKLIKQIQERIL